MSEAAIRPDAVDVPSLLNQWIRSQASEKSLAWLDEQLERISEGAPEWIFFTSFSSVPRHLGKADLALDDAALKLAGEARRGWNPRNWSIDQAGRTLLLLRLPHDDAVRYHATLEKVFQTADVGESVALYQALPLLPHPDRWIFRATEGIRSNMASVFEAVALRNPFPSEQFDEAQWNQMVLKAVFVGSPLHEIQGLDERANPRLARMLRDFAHERWAASRPVTPELWRLVGRFAGDEWVSDLEQVLLSGTPDERHAAAIALSESPSGRAGRALTSQPELSGRITRGELSWRHVAESLRSKKNQ